MFFAIRDIQNRITALDDPTYHQEAQDMYDNAILDALKDKQVGVVVEPADPYAEKRKWIGCLVEYGNADDGFRYGILTNIEPIYSAYPFEIDNGRDATADCWLPSKTIFYKGGDNERRKE